MITKKELESVIDELTDIVTAWNDVSADEDGGRTGDSLLLRLWGDGSGRIGRRLSGSSEVEDWHEFGNLDDLIEVLQSEGVEFEREKGDKP